MLTLDLYLYTILPRSSNMLELVKPRVFKIIDGSYYNTNDLVDSLYGECMATSWDYSRICFHKNDNSSLMSMLILMVNKFTYPPHLHSWKDESYSVICGEANLIFFDAHTCEPTNAIHMQPSSFFHNDLNSYHTFTPLTDRFAFIESTVGPFTDQNLKFLNI